MLIIKIYTKLFSGNSLFIQFVNSIFCKSSLNFFLLQFIVGFIWIANH